MREIKVMEGNRREAVKKIFKSIGGRDQNRGDKKIRKKEKRGTEMIWVKLGNKEQKKKVLKKKRNLKGTRDRIIEDLTWKERKTSWNLKDIVRGKRREQTGYG